MSLRVTSTVDALLQLGGCRGELVVSKDITGPNALATPNGFCTASSRKSRIPLTGRPGSFHVSYIGRAITLVSWVTSLERASPYPGPLVEIRFHELRHTAGTPALRQGVPLHAVSKMLGHSDPAMTLRRYAHVLEDMEDEGGRAMDELF
jgi:integrase